MAAFVCDYTRYDLAACLSFLFLKKEITNQSCRFRTFVWVEYFIWRSKIILELDVGHIIAYLWNLIIYDVVDIFVHSNKVSLKIYSIGVAFAATPHSFANFSFGFIMIDFSLRNNANVSHERF